MVDMMKALLVADGGISVVDLYKRGLQSVPDGLAVLLGGDQLAALTLRPCIERVGVAAWMNAGHWGGEFNVGAAMVAAVIVGSTRLATSDPWWPVYTSMLCGPVVFTGLGWRTAAAVELPQHVVDQVAAHTADEAQR